MMFFGLFGLVVPVLVMVLAASVAWRVLQRTSPRREFWVSGTTPELEARFARIEEAIDAMADQIERLTEAERQRLGVLPPGSLEEGALSAAREAEAHRSPLPPGQGGRDHTG